MTDEEEGIINRLTPTARKVLAWAPGKLYVPPDSGRLNAAQTMERNGLVHIKRLRAGHYEIGLTEFGREAVARTSLRAEARDLIQRAIASLPREDAITFLYGLAEDASVAMMALEAKAWEARADVIDALLPEG